MHGGAAVSSVAFHEAGHAALASVWGYAVVGCAVRGGGGVTLVDFPLTETATHAGRFRLATVYVAGKVCEELVDGLSGEAHADITAARRLIGDDLGAAEAAARVQLAKKWETVEAIQYFLDRGELERHLPL